MNLSFTKSPQILLIVSFFVVTCFLVRENWDLVPGIQVKEVIEAPKVSGESREVTQNSDKSIATEPIAKQVVEEPVSPVFEAFLDEIAERLPTKEQYQYLTAAEAHGHPRLLVETALDFGELADKLNSNVSLRPKGLEFYKGCALNSQLVNSVRAVCFHHAQVLEINLYARIWEYQREQIPSSVVELAKTL